MKSKNKSQGNKIKLALAAAAMLLAVLACSLPDTSGGDTGDAAPTPTVTPIVLEPQVEPEPQVIVTPTDTPLPVIVPEEPEVVLTGAACLPGLWVFDPEAAQSYVMQTMVGNRQLSFTPSALLGYNNVQITETHITGVAQDLQVQMVPADDKDTTITVELNGTSSGAYVVEKDRMIISNLTYSGSGELTEPVQTFPMDLSGMLDFAHSLGFAGKFLEIPSEIRMSFSCGGDVLSLRVNQYATIALLRVGD